MSATRRRSPPGARTGWCASLALAGCLQSGPAEDRAAAPAASPDPAPPPCGAVADDALAVIETDECPLQLRPLDGGVILHGLGPQPPPPLKGALPQPCGERPCRYEATMTELGPLVVASLVAPDSEMPAGMWLGVPLGDALRFVDLWGGAGQDVIGDGTELGPAYTLVPADCGGVLGLVPRPRLEFAQGLPVPEALQARAGRLGVSAAGELEVTATSPAGCKPLPVPLP